MQRGWVAPGSWGSGSTSRWWMWPASTSGQVPVSGRAGRGVVHQRDVDRRLRRADGGGQLLADAGDLFHRPVGWRREPFGEVSLSGVNRGSPMPAMVSPATVVTVLSSTIAFGCRATAAAVAAESWLPRMKTYGTLSSADGADEGRLRLAAPVGDVAGVDHHVDVELLHDGADHLPPGRVEVQVGDVQDPGGALGGFEDRQRGDRGVELADVADQPLQLVGVLAVVVGDAPGVADHRGRVDQQTLVAGLLDRLRSYGQRGDAQTAAGDQQRQPAGPGDPPDVAEDQGGEEQRGEYGDREGAQPEPDHPVGDVVDGGLAGPGDPGRVVDQRLGAALVEGAELHRQVGRPVVAVELQRAQRRDVDRGAAAHRGGDRHLGAERADVDLHPAAPAAPRRRHRRGRPAGCSGRGRSGGRRSRSAPGRRGAAASAGSVTRPRADRRPVRRRRSRGCPSAHHDLPGERSWETWSGWFIGGCSASAGAAAGEDQPDDPVVVRGGFAAPVVVGGGDPERAVRGGDGGAQPAVLAGQQGAGVGRGRRRRRSGRAARSARRAGRRRRAGSPRRRRPEQDESPVGQTASGSVNFRSVSASPCPSTSGQP